MQIFREENVIINVNILRANNLPLLRDKGRLFVNKRWLIQNKAGFSFFDF